MSQSSLINEEDNFLDIDDPMLQSAPENSTVFLRIIGAKPPTTGPIVKDKCKRLKPTYNENYDPAKPPRIGLDPSYSLYVNGEPLFNNRPVNLKNLPRRHTLISASKRLYTH